MNCHFEISFELHKQKSYNTTIDKILQILFNKESTQKKITNQ